MSQEENQYIYQAEDLIELSVLESKSFVLSQKSCSQDINWILIEPKFGSIKFDFSSINGIVSIYGKRGSGNGKFQVIDIDSNESIDYNFISKISEVIIIPFQKFEIRRENAIGEIFLLGFSIKKNMNLWKETLSKCNYSGLRVVGNQLLASKNGIIENEDNVSYIETNPPNLFIREQSKIKFLETCEILKLEISGEKKPSSDPFIHRNEAFPKFNIDDVIHKETEIEARNIGLASKVDKELSYNNRIIYDSSINKDLIKNIGNSKNVKNIVSNGLTYLCIKRGGLFNKNVSQLEFDKKYSIVLHCKKLNGNGKIKVGLVCDNNTSYQTVIVDSIFNDKTAIVTLSSNIFSPSNEIKISIGMFDDGIGEILISKLLIIEDFKQNTAKPKVNLVYKISNYNIDPDEITALAKKYARPLYSNYNFDKINLKKLVPLNLNANKWIWKLNSFCNFDGEELFIGNFKVNNCNNIWADNQDSNIDYFDSIENIMTCSFDLKEQIESKFNKKVIICNKPLFCVSPIKVPYFSDMRYFVHFCRDKETTKQFIENWNNEIKLVVIGWRGNTNNCIVVNEYLPYSKLLYILLNSLGIIDYDKYNNYLSSWLDLSQNLGLPIATNNKQYNQIDKKDAIDYLLACSKQEPNFEKQNEMFFEKIKHFQ